MWMICDLSDSSDSRKSWKLNRLWRKKWDWNLQQLILIWYAKDPSADCLAQNIKTVFPFNAEAAPGFCCKLSLLSTLHI